MPAPDLIFARTLDAYCKSSWKMEKGKGKRVALTDALRDVVSRHGVIPAGRFDWKHTRRQIAFRESPWKPSLWGGGGGGGGGGVLGSF